MYKSANSLTFKKRIENIEHGSGKLVKASYTAYSKLKGKYKTKGWFIAPDADQKWVYSFDYDAVKNKDYRIKIFDSYNLEWLEYVVDVAKEVQSKPCMTSWKVVLPTIMSLIQ